MTWGASPTGANTWRANSSVPKRLATLIVACPSAPGGGGKTLAIPCRQARIHQLPAGLEGAAQDGIPGLIRGAFQFIQGRFWCEGRDIESWQIEGGQFGHGIGGLIVHLADNHTDAAHRFLPG